MTKEVMTIHREDKLIDAAHVMIGAHVSCLIVLEDYKPIGIITERDFIKKMSMTKDSSEDMLVNDIMTKKLYTAKPGTGLFEAQEIMKKHNFRKLIIVEHDELKGIITQTDLCRKLSELNSCCPEAPKVKDVMTKKVIHVTEDDKFSKIKKLMASKDIGSVVVAKKKELRGVFTEFDIVSGFFMNPNKLRKSYLKDMMTTPVICISPDFDLFEANQLMLEHNFRRLPVIDDKNELLGIVTQTDIARELYKLIDGHKTLAPNEPCRRPKTPECEVLKKGSIIFYKKAAEK